MATQNSQHRYQLSNNNIIIEINHRLSKQRIYFLYVMFSLSLIKHLDMQSCTPTHTHEHKNLKLEFCIFSFSSINLQKIETKIKKNKKILPNANNNVQSKSIWPMLLRDSLMHQLQQTKSIKKILIYRLMSERKK